VIDSGLGQKPYPRPFSGADIRGWIQANLPAYRLIGPPIPDSIRTVLRLGIFLTDPARVVLYGSRARNTERADSDFDLAFFGMRNAGGLRRLRADVEDEPITLRQVDLLDISEASDELRQNVEREGRLLYESSGQTEIELPEGAR
jgi:predicted nucleotidyltransferase